jgi:hypothetical protein
VQALQLILLGDRSHRNHPDQQLAKRIYALTVEAMLQR